MPLTAARREHATTALIGKCLRNPWLQPGQDRPDERALKLLTPLRAAHLALGDTAGFAEYLDELRDRHRIRPTFLRKLAAWRG